MDICFAKNKILNIGGFGTIYKENDKAIKVVNHRHGSIQNLLELILYFSLSTYLVQAHSYEIDKLCYKIYMPLALYDLSKVLKLKLAKSFDVISVLHDICMGVEYLHSRNIIHGDIKPSNILIFKNHKTYVAKITDFSLSGLCYERINNKYAYTNGYRAPEVELKGSYSFKADVWALGQTFKKMQNKFPILQTKEFDNLIHNMMLNKEEDRYTIYNVLSNDIFRIYKPPEIQVHNNEEIVELTEKNIFIAKLLNKMMRKFVQENEDFIEQEISYTDFLVNFFQVKVF